MEKKKKFSISLTTQILIATVGGIVFGALVGPWAGNLKFIGDIFLRLIQMSVVLLGHVFRCGGRRWRRWKRCRKDGGTYDQVDCVFYRHWRQCLELYFQHW